jgi:protein SCO1/2
MRLLKFIPATLILLLLSACGAQNYDYRAESIKGMMPSLDFTLIDQDGQVRTAADYKGKIKLLYFGYTHCPDECPLALAKLSSALGKLSPEQRKHFRILFVSVDPARDTPAVMKSYVTAFTPEMVGLSGDLDALRKLSQRYRVTFSYGKKEADGSYVVSHSLGVYIFDGAGNVQLLTRGSASRKDLVHDFLLLLKADRQAG